MTFLGIDFGTSGARAMVIDEAGDILWQQTQSFSSLTSGQWLKGWKTALFELISAIPAPEKAQLQAIAINGTSSTVILCDSGGNPITEPILYNDHRGMGVKSQLAELAPPRHLVQSSTSSLAKLLWWSSQDYFSQAHYFLHQADWLASLLHAQRGISDYHNALKLGYDGQALRYPNWLENSSLRPLLPEIFAPGTPIAPLQPSLAQTFGLPTTCWICTGTTDSIAAFLASGAQEPGDAVTSLGSTLVLKLLSHSPIEDLATGVYSHRLGNLWLTGGASNSGGAVLRHFFNPQQLAQLSAQINPHQPSTYDYYPLLSPGERFPFNDPQFVPRLSPRPDDDRAFLQGLLEGLARIEALGYQTLEQLGASPLRRVYSAGGGAQNSTWQAIRVRQLQIPILVSPQTEAAYGTARLAQRAGTFI